MRLVRILLFVTTYLLLAREGSGQTTQTYNVDSLKRLLATNMDDTSRIKTLNNLGRNIHNSDTMLLLAEQAIKLSQDAKFQEGEAEAYNNIGYWYNQKGNYPKALQSYLKSIQVSEDVNYEAGLKRSYNSIATVYLYFEDYQTAIGYSRKARSLSIKQNDLIIVAASTSWLSKSYLELHQTDSALKYAQESYEAAASRKQPLALYFATARLGEVHAAAGNATLALEYLRLSLYHSKKDGRYFRIAGAHQELASLFKNMGIKDSSMWHAKQASNLSQTENLTATLSSSSLLLSELYEGVNDSESLRYHKLALAAKDSLFSQNKNQQVEAMRYSEIQRQQEAEALKIKAVEDRKNNLQYAAIFLGFVLFVITFLLLSHSILANPRLIKFFGVLALLIIFEFINLLIGPFIDTITDHSPLFMLVIMVCVAALLIPIHNRLESWITHKLVEKNNKIRLAAAKKVIATLETENKN